MRYLKFQLLVIGWILGSWSSQAWATTLNYDQPTSGSIASVAQTNSYSFTADKGDVLNFTVVATKSITGTLGPCILLYDPNENQVDSAGGSYNTDVEMNGYQVVLSGTYTALISDCANAATGEYVIFVQKTNDPVGSVPLPFAIVKSGSIGSAAQSNAYTLTADKGDVLNFTVVATTSTSGTLGPCILLYNSAGTPLLDSAGGSYNTDVEMNGYVVPATGAYNVLIKDCADTATGDYKLFVQKTNDPINSVPIVFNQIQTGNIATGAQSNAYTFTGTMNDLLNFTVVTTTSASGTLGPCISLYNTTGTPVLDSAGGSYNTDVEMNGYKIPADGTYNVFIKDCADTATGSYTLATECIGVCVLPKPVLTSISPTSAIAGGKGFSLTVNGYGFASVLSQSVVEWNGVHLATGFVNTTQLTATVLASDITVPGTFEVTVDTPAHVGGISNPLPFTVLGAPATPIFSPVAGTYILPQSVKITDATSNAAIFYTTDGTNPATSPTRTAYSAPINVKITETIMAVAVANGFTSPVASATYKIESQAPPPVFSPAAGTYESVKTITLTDPITAAVIYYTTNGTVPTTSSTKYTGPITVSSTATIEAIAVAPGYSSSAVAKATYEILGSPSCLSAPATSISTPGTTLNAVVNTLGLTGSYIFQYGKSSTALTTSTSKTALSASTALVKASAQLTGLSTKTTYYFQVVATTAGGSCSSSVLSFTTN